MSRRRKRKKHSKKAWSIIPVALVIVLVCGMVLMKDLKNTEEPSNDKEPTVDFGTLVEDDVPALKADLPSMVEVQTQIDTTTGKRYVGFPCEIEGYNLLIEKIVPFSGKYIEDGSNQNVSDVAMIKVKNCGDYIIEYAEVKITYGQEVLEFRFSILPEGETVLVQEYLQKNIPSGAPTACEAMVIPFSDKNLFEPNVMIEDNGAGDLRVTNNSGKNVSTIRIFYKYYAKEESCYLGGITFTAKISQMAKDSQVIIQPTHYESNSSRIVRVLAYDEAN